MNDTEKILSFGEMVDASERLSERGSKPWRIAFIVSNIAHVIIEIALCIILGMMVYLAYMEPVEVRGNQEQDYDTQNQTQEYHYSENSNRSD